MKVFYSVLLLHLNWCLIVFADLNPEWHDTGPWARQKHLKQQILKSSNGDLIECPPTESVQYTDDQHAAFLYRKLAKYILNPSKMKQDSNEGFHRILHLRITKDQMDRFEKLTTLQDMDGLLSDVFEQSKSGNFELIKEVFMSWRDQFSYYYHTLYYSSEFWLSMKFICIIFVYLASKKYNFNFWFVAVCAVGFFVYGIMDTECNRKKDIERLVDLMDQKVTNPCDINSYSFWGYWFGNPSSECRQYLTKTKSAGSSCSIIDVGEEFLNVFYRQIFNFFTQFSEHIFKMRKTHGVIATAIFGLVLYALMPALVKSIFKYILSPSVWRTNQNIRYNQQLPNVDGISGSLVEKLIETNAKLSETLIKQLPSGVEVLYSVERNETKLSIKSSESNADDVSVEINKKVKTYHCAEDEEHIDDNASNESIKKNL